MKKNKNPVFTGCATALITPFRDGKIDCDALENLIEFQIRSGIDALLVAGTTGEASTLSFEEHGKIIRFAKEKIAGRVPLLAGCGSNCTSRAAELVKIACGAGADALLAVTPYYNKTSDTGILLHYEELAKVSSRPILVYNVPSRTGFRLTADHYRKLAQIDGIAGVKEASGDLGLLEQICSALGDRLDVYTGNDDQTIPAMKLGAKGVISVCSNICPAEMTALCRACLSGHFDEASRAAEPLLPKMKALFLEVNPIPVKYAAAEMGLCQAEYRLPLCPPSPETRRSLDRIFGGRP